jgi:glycosyltransferase involved in cell wall biosynthesis
MNHSDRNDRRLRLGLLMVTSLLGGAERYLRDVYQHMNSGEYDVTLFVVRWPALLDFLGVSSANDGGVVALPVAEPGVKLEDTGTTGAGHGAELSRTLLGRSYRAFRSDGVVRTVVVNPVKLVYWWRTVSRLRRLFREHRVDVLHVVNGGYPGAIIGQAAMVAAMKSDIPTRIMTVCSTASPRPRHRPIERHIDHVVGQSVQALVVPAERTGQSLVERDLPRSALRIIPWGVDAPPVTQSRVQSRESARRGLGLPLEDPVIGTLANFTPTKGHAVLLRAGQLLRDEFPTLHVVLAGTGSELRNVKSLANQLNATSFVSFPGRIDNPYKLMQALDVFVLASDVEGLPYVVIEALSQGVPLVATDVGGMPEVIDEGANGYLVPPRDPEALAARLGDILRDPQLGTAMGGRARELYRERFSLDAMLRSHRALYTELSQGASCPL